MTPLTLVIPRHNYLIVATKVGGTLIGCTLLLLSGWVFGFAEIPDSSLQSGVQQARRATVGVLQPGETPRVRVTSHISSCAGLAFTFETVTL